jgi:hypothetical protein
MRITCSGVALIALLGASCSRATPYRPVMTVKEMMEATVEPVAFAVFDSAVWINGELSGAPQNEEEWERIEHSALTLAETGNLLMMPPRARDDGLWMAECQALIDAAVAAAKATQTRNPEAMFKAGSTLYESCTSCHRIYAPALVPPQAAPR